MRSTWILLPAALLGLFLLLRSESREQALESAPAEPMERVQPQPKASLPLVERETVREEGSDPVAPVGLRAAFQEVHEEAPRLELIVRDRDSGVDLEDVSVGFCEDGLWPYLHHPGDLDRVREVVRGPSPLAIADPRLVRESPVTCFVHAPGHAWTSLEIDFRRGGEREVLLVPGADLEVTFHPSGPRPVAWLMLGTPGRVLTQVPLPDEGPLRLEDLEPGPWRILVGPRTGDDMDWNALHANDPVELRAGALTSIELTLKSVPERLRAGVSGTVRIAPEWEATRPRASLHENDHEARRSFRLESLGGSLWRWSQEDVLTGPAQLDLPPFGAYLRFDVGPDGAHDLHLDVPPPARITVRAVDAETRRLLPITMLRWSRDGTRASDVVEPEGSSFAVTFPGPRGPLRLSCTVDGYDQPPSSRRKEPYRITGEVAEVEIFMTRERNLLIRLMDGETPVPVEGDPILTCLDGDGEVMMNWFEEPLRVTLSREGTYRVEIPRIERFHPLEPATVRVGTEGAAVRFDLVRSK